MIFRLNKLAVFVLIVFYNLFNQLSAHELQPSTLEIRQLTKERYDISWRAPIYYKKAHPAKLQLPEDWQTVSEPRIKRLIDSHLHRYRVLVPDGELNGDIIRFPGLEATITDIFVRLMWLDGSDSTALVRPGVPWLELSSQRSTWQVTADYTQLGVDHILSGFDHLAFVLALLLIVSGAKRLLVTITSFTLAHSITLGAATLEFVWLPGPPVEAVIALSILFLANELVKVNQGQKSLTAEYPWGIAFAFGLLHGLGFAGALTDIGLPQNEIVLALLMFNIGVEIGQLIFIAVVICMMLVLKRIQNDWPRWSYRIPAYAIGGTASFWLIERLASF